MGKATLVLVTVAALGFGALVGYSLVDDEQDDSAAGTTDTATMISTGGAPVIRYLSPGDSDVGAHDVESGDPFADGENFISQDDRWKSETLEIELLGDARVEYKVFMSQGDSIAFNWHVEGDDVYFDFHAHDDAFGEEFYTRYDAGRDTAKSGTIIAAYDGQHGWYWQNLEPDDVTLTLEVAGFYDQVLEIDLATD